MSKFLKYAFYAFCGLFLISECFAQTSVNSKQTVPIGLIFPLTGGQAPSGEDMMQIIQIAAPLFSAKSFKFDYKIVVDDGKCGISNAPTTIVNKYISLDNIKFIIVGCSGETLQAAPIAQRSKVVLFATLSNHKDVKHLGDYIFRTMYDIESDMNKFASFLNKDLNGSPIAIIVEENAFTIGMSEILRVALKDRVTFYQTFSPDTGDFRSLLARIKHSNAKGLYLSILSDRTLATIVNQAREINIPQQLYSYGTLPQGKYFLEATKRNADGLKFLGNPNIKNCSVDYQEALAQFKKTYQREPSYEFVTRTAYDALKSIVESIEVVGPDPAKVKEYLKTYSSYGALGPIAYDQYGDVKNIHTVVKTINNSNVSIIDELE